MAERSGPTWLKPLLDNAYFDHCGSHPAASKNERKFYCRACESEALCHICVDKEHSGHRDCVLQIFRSSYCDAVRIEDISGMVNLADMQRYKINNKPIVFLNARPQAKQQKGINYTCEACNRMLNDPTRFCSLGCKLQIAAKDSRVSLTLANGAGHSGATEKAYVAHEPKFVAHASPQAKGSYGNVKLAPKNSSPEPRASKKHARDEANMPEPPATPEVKKVHRRKGIPRQSPAVGEHYPYNFFSLQSYVTTA